MFNPRLMIKVISGICVFTAAPILAHADNCSSPEDCIQTAGYNAMIALGGGLLGIVAALYGSHLAKISGSDEDDTQTSNHFNLKDGTITLTPDVASRVRDI